MEPSAGSDERGERNGGSAKARVVASCGGGCFDVETKSILKGVGAAEEHVV
jgi:hypothetical protein